ncbi:PI16-like protein [Mya arenaria]|uniref:PI16-like protein n=1 Tax=Mya arenaria TaxID=6604 RepID=A0ABY7FRL3_MYAAR|nr:PI16-like protein [Mya arenaria]
MASLLTVGRAFRFQLYRELLKWDDGLQRKAEMWSENCYFDHQRDGLGENLAFVVTGGPDMQDLDIIVHSCRGWWNEVYNWTWSTACVRACHYTQMIWGKTERLGCSLSKCPQMQVDTGKNMDDIDFFVCFYDPPGNSIGKYPYTLGEPCSHCDRLDECHGGLCKSPSLNNSNSSPTTNTQPQSEATLTDSAMTDANVYTPSRAAPSQELNK